MASGKGFSPRILMIVVVVMCIRAVVTRSIHKSRHHHNHDRLKTSHSHQRMRHSGDGHLGESRLVDMEQRLLEFGDEEFEGHPVVKRQNDIEEFSSEVQDLQNCAVCSYTVTLVPQSDVYEVPENLVNVTCNEDSVGKSCSETGLDFVCMQTFTHVKFPVKGKPQEFKKKRIDTGCVCALREIPSLIPKHAEEIKF